MKSSTIQPKALSTFTFSQVLSNSSKGAPTMASRLSSADSSMTQSSEKSRNMISTGNLSSRSALDVDKQMVRKVTYRLKMTKIQEFSLPKDHICTAIQINQVLNEAMFACKDKGLLHYRWSDTHGLIYADKPLRKTHSDYQNTKLVECHKDGTYLVLNNTRLCLMMLYKIVDSVNKGSVNHYSSGIHSHSVDNREYRDYFSQSSVVGNVRSIGIDKEAQFIYVLYTDRILRYPYPDLNSYSKVSVCDLNRNIKCEMVKMVISWRYVYILTSQGDIKIRYSKEQMRGNKDELIWRPFGHRFENIMKSIEEIAQKQNQTDKQKYYIEKESETVTRDTSGTVTNNKQDRESYVEYLGMAVDDNKSILFVSGGVPKLYAVWPIEINTLDLGDNWNKNWLEDQWIVIQSDMDELNQDKSEPIIPGPLACISTINNKHGYLYVLDIRTRNTVVVLKYICTAIPFSENKKM